MISVLYTIILITNFKLIEMCIKSSPMEEGQGGGAACCAGSLHSSPFGEVGWGFNPTPSAVQQPRC